MGIRLKLGKGMGRNLNTSLKPSWLALACAKRLLDQEERPRGDSCVKYVKFGPQSKVLYDSCRTQAQALRMRLPDRPHFGVWS
ncbi:hypothetical protein Taro_051305 [Colocasia esculenta]|uniref:Uncharacterized protein n=1 Tax=Colocasia esculenta TaxID=4460 RepID=A0A843XG71_COLES|nr:hypothetical protein [Colocasia esculenta]